MSKPLQQLPYIELFRNKTMGKVLDSSVWTSATWCYVGGHGWLPGTLNRISSVKDVARLFVAGGEFVCILLKPMLLKYQNMVFRLIIGSHYLCWHVCLDFTIFILKPFPFSNKLFKIIWHPHHNIALKGWCNCSVSVWQHQGGKIIHALS